MPEIDLIDEKKGRAPLPRISRRGCAQLFGQVLMLVGIFGFALEGLR